MHLWLPCRAQLHMITQGPKLMVLCLPVGSRGKREPSQCWGERKLGMCFFTASSWKWQISSPLFFFRALPAAYGGSQARGYNWNYSCQPTPQPQQCRIQATSAACTTAHGNVESLTQHSEARNQTQNLMVPSQIHFCCVTVRTPPFIFYGSALIFSLFLSFLWMHQCHMEVPKLGV